MRNSAKRRWVLLVAGLLAIPLTSVAISYACTALATLNTSSTAAMAGSSLTVTGTGFSPHDPSDNRTESVKLRFDSADGPVVGEASPSSGDQVGRFSATIAVPALDPGAHVLIATQNGADGRPAYGTPARLALEVLAPPAPAPAPGPAAPALPAPQIQLPALSQLLTAADKMTLSKAVLKCKQRYRTASAKTATGRKRMAKKRASCIAQAKKKFA